MTDRGARWADLMPRIVTGVIMLVIGAAEVWAGGWVFAVGVWILGGAMTWELSRMLAPAAAGRATWLGALSSCVLALAWMSPGVAMLPLFGAAAIVGAGRFEQHRWLYVPGVLAILLGCHAMEMVREHAGLAWLLWVICIVIVSDIAGYFAGRLIGGPKFWPSVSPKKTWSGTIAGWIGAGLVGAAFLGPTGAGAGLIAVSVLIGFAGQMGDIAESAIKRRVGVKDSSNLLPGHGGVLDRFDAMLGAALAVGLLWLLGLIPGLA